MDIGASTGGFTDVLLNNEAKKIFAVDVGFNQLHEKIKKGTFFHFEMSTKTQLVNPISEAVNREQTGRVECTRFDYKAFQL